MADETGLPPSGAKSASSAAGGHFAALRSGLAIRQYVIEEVIGAGGFGITYRARHERLTSKVFALKEFFPRQFAARQDTHVVSTPDGDGLFRWGLDRFLKEAEALAKCEHPGIVDVVDYFEENGTAYAVLGYVEGQQLGQWLDSLGRPPTQGELDRILMPLLDALETVHAARLLHRDIAPDNVLIRSDGSPCLIDFGACREDIRDRSRKLSAIVKHGYSPPEQYHGIADLQGPWTDIYAVAATLYRAISGHAPMDSSLRGALGDGLQPVSRMTAADYRPGFLAAIDVALDLKPDQRPQSIADWRTMLFLEAPAQTAARPHPSGSQTAASAAMQPGAVRAADPMPPPSSGIAGSTSAPAIGSLSDVHAPGATAPVRRGPVFATLAVLALVAVGAAAWWREPAPDGPSFASPTVAPSGSPALTTSAPAANPEKAAEAAWAPLASSDDRAAIERFLAEHGSTQAAAAARTRLAALHAKAAAATQAKADANARAQRQQALDRNWQTCRDAPESEKATACATVIQSDDTAARRADALHLVGMAARNAGDYDKAIAHYTQSLSLVADHAQVLNDRGIAHFLKGGVGGREAALMDYNSAINANPRHAEALNNRAWSLFQAGRAAEALADANRSIEATATNGYAYDTRGQILEALGRKDDAIRDYEHALRLDPGQETSRSGLARLRASAR